MFGGERREHIPCTLCSHFGFILPTVLQGRSKTPKLNKSANESEDSWDKGKGVTYQWNDPDPYVGWEDRVTYLVQWKLLSMYAIRILLTRPGVRASMLCNFLHYLGDKSCQFPIALAFLNYSCSFLDSLFLYDYFFLSAIHTILRGFVTDCIYNKIDWQENLLIFEISFSLNIYL